MSARIRWGVSLLLGLVAATLQAGAMAEEPTQAERDAARTLLLDGRAKLAAGDARGALKSLEKAHAIMSVPTTGIELAKAQAALGMLVEARATALGVTAVPVKSGEPKPFTDARSQLTKLAEELKPRIASLELRVTGLLAAESPRVMVDGIAVPSDAVKLPREVNPGEHAFDVTAPGYVPLHRDVTLNVDFAPLGWSAADDHGPSHECWSDYRIQLVLATLRHTSPLPPRRFLLA